jgi:O-antigen biosynthesis protein WbqP
VKRLFDIVAALILLIPGLPLMAIGGLAILLSDGRPVFFVQQRVGRMQKPFTCVKLRTMSRNTPNRASHEIGSSAVFPAGRTIRRFKLDELPQLFNVLAGQMSMVGPRPCLPVQAELIALRQDHGIFALWPGITGLAQVRGIDMSNPGTLVACEVEYLQLKSLMLDLRILLSTLLGRGLQSDAATHRPADQTSQVSAHDFKPSKSIVIGAAGFVGQALVARLGEDGSTVRLAQRHLPAEPGPQNHHIIKLRQHHSETSEADFDALFAGIQEVFFLAAATPQALKALSPEARKTVSEGMSEMPLAFARAAARRGVKRFVFVSSCGVHGPVGNDSGFDEHSPLVGHDDYVASKIAAEQLLRQATDVPPVTIVRPPMVYGPGLKGPMRHLLRLVAKGIPLPLGAISNNRRSMIGVRNLADFLVHCARHPDAADETFLVADNTALSTSAFLREAAKAFQVPSRLLPVPASLLKLPLALIGKARLYDRFFGDYLVDDSKARMRLGWNAPHDTVEELRTMTFKD